MKTRQLTIPNKLGLHARAAARLVNTASQFESDIYLEKEQTRVNGKSIMGVMMLAAAQGTVITIIADGQDEEAALEAVQQLVEAGFGEEQ
ncbi:MAG TPA: HPr family phosphocarrier protein [Chromatiaceae bacterium]|nr:HPr family phosphocarrier protein [Chromatiaceae bacterium]